MSADEIAALAGANDDEVKRAFHGQQRSEKSERLRTFAFFKLMEMGLLCKCKIRKDNQLNDLKEKIEDLETLTADLQQQIERKQENADKVEMTLACQILKNAALVENLETEKKLVVALQSSVLTQKMTIESLSDLNQQLEKKNITFKETNAIMSTGYANQTEALALLGCQNNLLKQSSVSLKKKNKLLKKSIERRISRSKTNLRIRRQLPSSNPC